MQQSTARRIDPTKAATTRPTPKASSVPPRGAKHRPTRADALRQEVDRIQRDIEELKSDFETRIGPLCKAFAAAHKKLRELEAPSPKPRKRR